MTARCYFELRTSNTRASDSLSADLTRHLHTRQYLGKAVVICARPASMLSSMRKQWLKLSRAAQKQRASTLNADKILKYTHVITRMQHLQFTIKSPLEQPDADVYILSPADTALMPPQCWSVYIERAMGTRTAQTMAAQLPPEALIVDYTCSDIWTMCGLAPKSALEAHVRDEWRQARHFLKSYRIDVATLTNGRLHNIEAIDNALDTLLAVSHKFLAVANEFQRTLELARPLRVPKKLREEYDSFILLAHRVQALSPGPFTRRFLETYNEDDTFFLRDSGRKRLAWTGETLAQAVSRHLAANRRHLAQALQVIGSA